MSVASEARNSCDFLILVTNNRAAILVSVSSFIKRELKSLPTQLLTGRLFSVSNGIKLEREKERDFY